MLRNRIDMRTISVAAIALVMTGGIATACAGKTVALSSSDGGSGDDGGTGTDGSVTVGCPSTAPWQRTTANGPKNPCSKEVQICEYGADFDPRCNVVVACIDGEWGTPFLPGSGTPPKCGSSRPPLIPPNPADCPASRSTLAEGQSCASSSTCAYDGATCTCGVFCPSYPIGQPTCNPDAGITTNCCDLSKPHTWSCFDGPAYCPAPRPHLGDPCAKDGDSCALSPPAECGQTVLRCTSGTWQLPNSECPISTARAKRDIGYLAQSDVDRLRDELLRVQLATYRYKAGDSSSHLGFIIEDMPEGSPAVLASRDRVDLYGYVSMTVAAVQAQQRQIERLEAELARVKRECR